MNWPTYRKVVNVLVILLVILGMMGLSSSSSSAASQAPQYRPVNTCYTWHAAGNWTPSGARDFGDGSPAGSQQHPTHTYTIPTTVTADPDIEVSPTLFDELVWQDEMLTQTLTISNTGDASLLFLINDGGVPWFSQNPDNGMVAMGEAQLVDVVFDATGLTVGDYTADVTIASNDPDENFVTLPITMHVTDDPRPPTISGIPDQVVIPGMAYTPLDLWSYASDPDSPVDVLTYTIDNIPNPDAGVSIDSNRYVDIDPTPGWTGHTIVVIRVTDPDDLFDTTPFSVSVRLPDIEVRPIAFDEALQQDETLTRTLTISNTATASLPFLIDDGGVSWLSQNPVTGTVTVSEAQSVNVIFDATGLAIGVYSTSLTISNDDPAGVPVTIPVTMHVIFTGDLASVYLPFVIGHWPPTPHTPVLNAISNPENDGDYIVSWSAADLAETYTLQEDNNASFSSPTTVYGSGTLTSTSITGNPPGTYYYRVKATNYYADSGWSNVQSVTVQPQGPTPGWWAGSAEFYVTPDSANIEFFMITLNLPECGGDVLVEYPLTYITNNRFSFGGPFYASGTFDSTTTASGTAGLDEYLILGCGYVTGGPWSWNATWQNDSQPTI